MIIKRQTLLAFCLSLTVILLLGLVNLGQIQLAHAADAPGTSDSANLANPLCPPDQQSCATGWDPRIILGNIIKGVLGLVGSVALVLFIYGGIQLMISQGKPDKISKGRDTMLWAAVGLAVIFSSYAITNYVISKIVKAP